MKRIYIRRGVGLVAAGAITRGVLQFTPLGGEDTQEAEKQPFFVETATFAELQQAPTISKNGKVVGDQTISVTAQVNGRVAAINYKAGQEVSKDAVVVQLEDTSGVYTFNAQKAAAALEQAQINYESTLLGLDKAVTDTKHALEQAQSQYNSATTNLSDSATNLQIDKAESELEKAKFDYQTQVQNDQQTIQNFLQTTANLTNEVKLLYEDVISETDSILGITDLRKYENDSFEGSLGARNTQTKRDAEDALRRTLNEQKLVEQLPTQVPQSELVSHLQTILESTTPLAELLNKTEQMLQHTPTSDLSATELAAKKSAIGGLQTKVQTTASSLTQQINTIKSFLATYRQQQESLAKNIAIAEQQVDLTVRNLRDSETSANIGLDSAQAAYENAQKNKTTTQQSLQNAIQQAQISYNEAQKQLSKLQVESPIDGTVGQVMVDVGQEVTPGVALFAVDSAAQPEISISLGRDELQYVTTDQQVNVIVDNEIHTGIISSIAKTADSNFTYQAIIELDSSVQLLGTLAEVEIPVDTDVSLVPIRLVDIINTTSGILNTYENGSLNARTVELGEVWGSLIEIRSDIAPSTRIITSSVSNFDPTSFELQLKGDSQ